MADVRVEIHGLEEVVAKYQRISDKLPEELKRLMTRSIIYAQGQIPAYPGAPPTSGYRRTGTLGRVVTAFPGVHGGRNLGGNGGDNGGTPLTRVEMMGGGVRGVIGGRLSYLPDVVGEGTQKAPFQGRWWTLQAVIRGAKNGIVEVFREGFKQLFD